MPLSGLNIVLVKTRFPENIGMAARACANMGCADLRLVAPERWNHEKALPLATAKGAPILENIDIYPSLDLAIAKSNLVIGSTARVGGWRKKVIPAAEAGEKTADALLEGESVSLVFGPEDRGLANEEIILCQELAHIKISGGASSLNLAQCVLLLLYECAQKMEKREKRTARAEARPLNRAERVLLEDSLKEILADLGCMHGEKPDYYFIQWRNILDRAKLRRHEFDALMGFCRRVRNRLMLK